MKQVFISTFYLIIFTFYLKNDCQFLLFCLIILISVFFCQLWQYVNFDFYLIISTWDLPKYFFLLWWKWTSTENVQARREVLSSSARRMTDRLHQRDVSGRQPRHRSLYGVFLQTVEANGDSDCPCSQEKVSHTVFNKRGGWQGRPFCLNRPSAVISIPISVLPCLAHKRLLKPVFTWRNTWMFWSYKYINIDKPTH